MKKKPQVVLMHKKEIKELFRKSTGFCAWDMYEKGYKIRDNHAKAGIDYYLSTFKKERKAIDKKKLLNISYNHLFKAIREIIDESYYLYYEVNGMFREDKFKVSERNEIADKKYNDFIINCSTKEHPN